MSFAQMREKLGEGQYPSWTSVQTDLETMFNNAMVFNAPTTPYHKQVQFEMLKTAMCGQSMFKTSCNCQKLNMYLDFV